MSELSALQFGEVSFQKTDGTFEVTSFRPGDGLRPGDYSVLIEYHRLKPGGDPNTENGWEAIRVEVDNLTIESGTSGAVQVSYTVPAP